MKPNFSLDLAHDGVRLLHLGPDGSRVVGSVAFDDPQADTRLADLRAEAVELGGGDLATQLIVPASEILFTRIECAAEPGAVRAAMDGLTPYDVGELVVDWRRAGEGKVVVAAVARVTLVEAETFAAAHGFNPQSFTAKAKRGLFRSRPKFGATEYSTRPMPDPDKPDDADAQPAQGASRTAAMAPLHGFAEDRAKHADAPEGTSPQPSNDAADAPAPVFAGIGAEPPVYAGPSEGPAWSGSGEAVRSPGQPASEPADGPALAAAPAPSRAFYDDVPPPLPASGYRRPQRAGTPVSDAAEHAAPSQDPSRSGLAERPDTDREDAVTRRTRSEPAILRRPADVGEVAAPVGPAPGRASEPEGNVLADPLAVSSSPEGIAPDTGRSGPVVPSLPAAGAGLRIPAPGHDDGTVRFSSRRVAAAPIPSGSSGSVDQIGTDRLGGIAHRISQLPNGGAGPRQRRLRHAAAPGSAASVAGATPDPARPEPHGPAAGTRDLPDAADAAASLTPGAAAGASSANGAAQGMLSEADAMTVFGARKKRKGSAGPAILPVLIGLVVAAMLAIGIWVAVATFGPAGLVGAGPDGSGPTGAMSPSGAGPPVPASSTDGVVDPTRQTAVSERPPADGSALRAAPDIAGAAGPDADDQAARAETAMPVEPVTAGRNAAQAGPDDGGGDGDIRATGPALPAAPPREAAKPDVQPSPVLPGTDIAAPAGTVRLAAAPAAPAMPSADRAPGDAPAPAPFAAFDTDPLRQAASPDDTTRRYEVTGVWQSAPVPSPAPRADRQSLAPATFEDGMLILAAVQVPAPPETRNRASTALTSPLPPAPAGTTFDFVAPGIVRATPDGALSPDGIAVTSGVPPRTPPARGEETAGERAPATAQDTGNAVPTRESRPRSRPASAAANDTGTAAGAPAPSEIDAVPGREATDLPSPAGPRRDQADRISDTAVEGSTDARPQGGRGAPANGPTVDADTNGATRSASVFSGAGGVSVRPRRAPFATAPPAEAAASVGDLDSEGAVPSVADVQAISIAAAAAAQLSVPGGNGSAAGPLLGAATRPLAAPRTGLPEINAPADVAAPVELSAVSNFAVPRSLMPPRRPAVPAATAAPAPVRVTPAAPSAPAVTASATVAPRLPSSASVTKEATVRNALKLGRVNLLGVSGTPSRRRALIRLPSGKIVTVGVGDRLDGGRVAQIDASALQYVKGGRSVRLEMPRG